MAGFHEKLPHQECSRARLFVEAGDGFPGGIVQQGAESIEGAEEERGAVRRLRVKVGWGSEPVLRSVGALPNGEDGENAGILRDLPCT